MHPSRIQEITAPLSSVNMRTAFRSRRSVSSSSRDSSYSTSSTLSAMASMINSIVFQQPSIIGLEEERKSFPSELFVLEPRPILYWGSLEERIVSAHLWLELQTHLEAVFARWTSVRWALEYDLSRPALLKTVGHRQMVAGCCCYSVIFWEYELEDFVSLFGVPLPNSSNMIWGSFQTPTTTRWPRSVCVTLRQPTKRQSLLISYKISRIL